MRLTDYFEEVQIELVRNISHPYIVQLGKRRSQRETSPPHGLPVAYFRSIQIEY
jgi:hypothetical protein